MKPHALFRTNYAALICLSMGVVASGLIFLRLCRDDSTRVHEKFRREIDRYAISIDGQVASHIAILHSLKSLFDASEVVTRREFEIFASFLLSRYPSVNAVGWVPRIRADQRAAFEAEACSDGCDGFQITEQKEPGTMVPAAGRDDYYPVCFVEPLAGNETGLSFDLASNQARRDAIYAARDSGEARATDRISLVHETNGVWAVLILIPVYEGVPTTIAERRDRIRGVVSGVLRFRDLLSVAVAHPPPDGMIDMRLIDQSADRAHELLHASTFTGGELATTYRYETRLKPAGGRQWTLVATPSTAYVAAHRALTPWLCLLAGLSVSAGLSFYLYRLMQEKERVKDQVDLKTRELRAQSLALEASNADLAREGVERRRLQDRFAEVTDHEQRRLGQELHDSLGQQIAVTALLAQSLKQRLGDEDEATTKLLDRLMRSAKTAQAQVRAISKGLLPVEIEPGGLRAALEELVSSVQGVSGTHVVFESDADALLKDAVAATHLYRIAQEALHNALEHGQCSKITIGLGMEAHGLILTIRDDGDGFGEHADASTGVGMSTMHHRADLIGATLDIESPAGQGTSIVCRLPNAAA